MNMMFWIKRTVVSFLVAFALLLAVQLIKGFSLTAGSWFALIWGAIAAAIFTLVGYYRFKQNPACMTAPSEDKNQD